MRRYESASFGLDPWKLEGREHPRPASSEVVLDAGAFSPNDRDLLAAVERLR